jgi:DHA1 family bicyclomycin/chloramphenicol resistance-like MFS transporter
LLTLLRAPDVARPPIREVDEETDSGNAGRPWPLSLLAVLAGLSAFAPLTTDLYLPGLPQLRRDLGVTASSAEVTLTACVVGIAVGQLLLGPLSDTAGRRRPLLAGLVVFILSSAACAAASSVAVLDVLRLVQGIAGASGIVIARAMVRDMYSGLTAARLYATLSSLIPLAPILAPSAGGALLLATTWRGIFGAQALIGGALLLATVLATRETLPPSQRHPRSVSGALATYRDLARIPRYAQVLAAGSLGFAAFFAYIAASPFVYQSVLGLSPQAFGVLFALNGTGLLATNIANARLIRSIPQERLFHAGLRTVAAAGVLTAASAIAGLGAWALLPLMFVTVCSIGLIISNAVALSMALEGHRAGSAAALFGAAQFVTGAAVAPLVGVAGPSAVPMGLVMAISGCGALLIGRRTHSGAEPAAGRDALRDAANRA